MVVRLRPIEVHVNSLGKKHHIFQEILHAEKGYAYVPVDGPMKNKLYNKGFLDGRKKAVPFYKSLFECESQWALVFPVPEKEGNSQHYIGIISLNKTYLISIQEAERFLQNVCMNCECYGISKCYLSSSFDCGRDDRDQYRDGSWFEMQKEIRRNRKNRKSVFPG